VNGMPTDVAGQTRALPEWLKELQPVLDAGALSDCWQRLVDHLVVAGDHRIDDLVD